MGLLSKEDGLDVVLVNDNIRLSSICRLNEVSLTGVVSDVQVDEETIHKGDTVVFLREDLITVPSNTGEWSFINSAHIICVIRKTPKGVMQPLEG